MALKAIKEYFPKQKVMSVLEDTAKGIYGELLKPAVESMAVDSENSVVKALVGMLPIIDGLIKPALDNIDGEKD